MYTMSYWRVLDGQWDNPRPGMIARMSEGVRYRMQIIPTREEVTRIWCRKVRLVTVASSPTHSWCIIRSLVVVVVVVV